MSNSKPRKKEKITTDSFIQKSKAIHGDSFSYPNTVYVNMQTKVEVCCNKCKTTFMKMPASHLAGRGCRLCKIQERVFTKEVFVAKAVEVHGNKYDYTDTVYKLSSEKVEIHCNNCNIEFMQAPKDHLTGRGCPKCNLPNSGIKSLDEFIESAKNKYGEAFSFPNAEYLGCTSLIKIRCNTCDIEFTQFASAFLASAGCPSCIKKRKHDKFIKTAKALHGDSYDYSNTQYESYYEEVKIHCNTCEQDFMQKPVRHLSGSGCKKCRRFNNELSVENRKLQKEKIIQKAKLIFGEQYSFPNFNYINNYTDVEIHCNTCNKSFVKKPNAFLLGKGCPTCQPQKKKLEFLTEAQERYGSEYSYQNTVFIRTTFRVDIHCNRCDTDFRETPNNFLQGKGCPTCSEANTVETTSL